MIRFNLYILFKYIKGRGRHLFNTTAQLSFWGVFLSTCLLVVIMSIFNGFQNQIKNSIFNFEPHIVISNVLGDHQIKNWTSYQDLLAKDFSDSVERVGGLIQAPAIIKFDMEVDHVFLRGESLEEDSNGWKLPTYFPKNIEPSNLKYLPKGDYCLLGKELAVNLNLHIGDSISLIVPKGQFSLKLGVTANSKTYIISGFFKTGHYQYDSKVVLISLESAQTLFDISSNSVQSIFIRLKNINTLTDFTEQLFGYLPFTSMIHTIEDEQKNFFAALKLEKTVMFIIVSLFIIAAMIGITAATFSTVRNRTQEIGILKALGLSSTDILFIFTYIGFFMGILGTLLGVMSGIFISLQLQNIIVFVEDGINILGNYVSIFILKQTWYPIEILSKNTYYFDSIPIYFDTVAIYTVTIVSMILSGVSSFIPAIHASKLEVIDIIRSK